MSRRLIDKRYTKLLPRIARVKEFVAEEENKKKTVHMIAAELQLPLGATRDVLHKLWMAGLYHYPVERLRLVGMIREIQALDEGEKREFFTIFESTGLVDELERYRRDVAEWKEWKDAQAKEAKKQLS